MTFLHKLAQRLAGLKPRTVIGVGIAIAVAALPSCELPVSTTGSNAEVDQLIITPHTATLQENQDQDFTAVAFTATGDTAQTSVSWSVTGGAIIDTSATGGRHRGRYHGSKCGSFKIAATSQPGGKTDTATVSVVACPATVASVGVSPATPSVQVGQTVQLTATTLDSTGTVLTGRVVTWATSNASAATVSASGLVTGVAAGSATITATSEGQSGTSTVTVTLVPVASVGVSPATPSVQVGQTVQLSATPKDANGNSLTGRVVTWSSSNTGVATVNGSGVVTGIAAGSATITATSEGKSGTSTVTVTLVPVASVTVSPATASVSVGQTVPLTATPRDANGNALSGRVVTWGSSNTGVATVGASGVVTGVAAGSATITATSEGKSGTSTVTVTLVPVASVTVSPATASVQVGQTVPLTATPRDANGNALTGRVVTWGSSNTAVATVSASGVVTGVAAGSATITATSEGKSGTSTVTVTLVPVASVTVSPATASVQVGQTVPLTATPRDANGNALTGRVVTWGSSNTALATVSGSGLVSGVAAGSATITATSEGQSGASAITVTAAPVPVASVTVSPATASLQVGQTVPLTATPRDANGNALTGRVVTWGSSNTAVATVSASGLVTGIAAGSATITATSEGQSGTAALTVTNVPVASVTVSPATASVPVGQTVPLTATPRDANGNALSGRVVTWGSSNTAVATVSANGLVSGIAAGSATITATSEGKSGTATVTVTLVPVASVTVSPATASVPVGQTVPLTATPRDANGNALTGRVVTWGSSNTAVATVSASGLVTGIAAGSATITATSEGKSGTSAITVTASNPGGSQFGHVFIVTEENTDYSSVIGSSSMPYLNSLAQQYGLATQYYANTHPSIGNYFMLTTGQIITNNDNFSTIVTVDNIVRELLAAGKTWKSYAEDLPSVGYLGGDVGNYARKHNVFALLSDVANNSVQRNNLVPFTQFATDLANGTLPTFSNIVPNLCNDAHDCGLSTADTWLRNHIDPLIKSSTFQQDGLLIIVFDESSGDNTNGGGRIVWLAVSPKSKLSFKSTTLYQHQSTLRLALKGLGVTVFPGAAATARDMDEFFTP